jgi:hypothetical protein
VSCRLNSGDILYSSITILAGFSLSDPMVFNSLELDRIRVFVLQLTPSRLKSIIGLEEFSVSAKALYILAMSNVSENFYVNSISDSDSSSFSACYDFPKVCTESYLSCNSSFCTKKVNGKLHFRRKFSVSWCSTYKKRFVVFDLGVVSYEMGRTSSRRLLIIKSFLF